MLRRWDKNNQVAQTIEEEDAPPDNVDAESLHTGHDVIDADDAESAVDQSELDEGIMDSHANPTTKTGKRLQLSLILPMTLVPIILLVSFVGFIYGTLIKDFIETTTLRNTVEFSVVLTDVIHGLQLERDRSALYVTSFDPNRKAELFLRYQYTDEVIANLSKMSDWEIKTAPYHYLKSGEDFLNYLNNRRYQLDVKRPTQQEELHFYTDIIGNLITWFFDNIPEDSTGTIWKKLVSLNEVVESKEMFGVERAYGLLYYTNGGFYNREDYQRFFKAQAVANDSLTASREYASTEDAIFQDTVGQSSQFTVIVREMRYGIRLDPFGKTLNKSMLSEHSSWWYGNMTLCIDQLLIIQKNIMDDIRQILNENEYDDKKSLAGWGILFVLILVICPMSIRAVYTLIEDEKEYSTSLVERTKDLDDEQKRTDELLYKRLPKTVAEKLKNNEHVDAETFDDVTIFFSDLLDFTDICAKSSPLQVVQVLNSLYKCLDDHIKEYNVFKVDTIGDECLVVSGLPERNGEQHAVEIANMTLDIMIQVQKMDILHMPGTSLRLRIGCHTGAVVAGIVGIGLVRYCLFGETVSIAAKMEATGMGGKVHISGATEDILSDIGGFITKARHDCVAKKLGMKTYWLIGRTGKPLSDVYLSDDEANDDVLDTDDESTRDENNSDYGDNLYVEETSRHKRDEAIQEDDDSQE